MSIQLLTRNWRRVASLRGFSSVTIKEKSEINEKIEDTDKRTNSKPNSLNRKHSQCVNLYNIYVHFMN